VNFLDFTNHEEAKLALILNVIDPLCGGVIFIGERGCGKSTLMRLFAEVLPPDIPWVELPLNATQESLLGGVDFEVSLREGRKIYRKGILARAEGGFLYMDNLNLLPPEILSVVFSTVSASPPPFVPLATMYPEEGELSPHFLERFGMGIFMEGLKVANLRAEIVRKRTICTSSVGLTGLQRLIEQAKGRLSTVTFPSPMEEYIVDLAQEYNMASHRTDLFLFYAARAYAAFLGTKEVQKGHIDKMAPLVFALRSSSSVIIKAKEEIGDKPCGVTAYLEDERQGNAYEISLDRWCEGKGGKELDNWFGDTTRAAVGDSPEEVFEAEGLYELWPFFLGRDGKARPFSGRRGKSRGLMAPGRYVKGVLTGDKDVAVDATIRAAAPYQKRRGRKDRFLICPEDLRYKERERKTGNLFIFVIDASGSMGVHRKMAATKGVLEAMLKDCYRRRDRVAMVVFKKDKAEVVLPPTKVTPLAIKKLQEIPTGGKTPLAAGLWETYKLITREAHKRAKRKSVVVLLTDGKANQAMGEGYVFEELEKICELLIELTETEFMVVDTDPEGQGAAKLAFRLKGRYCPLSSFPMMKNSTSPGEYFTS